MALTEAASLSFRHPFAAIIGFCWWSLSAHLRRNFEDFLRSVRRYSLRVYHVFRGFPPILKTYDIL